MQKRKGIELLYCIFFVIFLIPALQNTSAKETTEDGNLVKVSTPLKEQNITKKTDTEILKIEPAIDLQENSVVLSANKPSVNGFLFRGRLCN